MGGWHHTAMAPKIQPPRRNMIYDKFAEDLSSDLRELLREINHKIKFGHMCIIVPRPGVYHKSCMCPLTPLIIFN